MSAHEIVGPIAASAETPAPPARRLWRAPVAAKLAIAMIGLVVSVLLINGAIDTWLSYNLAKSVALEVQAEKARSAAERVGEFLTEIESQLGWTIGAEWRRTQVDQQRYDFVRLLRQAPPITALSYLDGQGKEQLAVSRLEPDSVGGGRDFSSDPRFLRAVADKVWFGPVEFRHGSEPYMTIALAHVGKTPGVTVADVNLKLIWDVVSAIRVGDEGFAYVVDDRGRLIAHPDLSLVLRDTDFSKLPQVAAALAGRQPSEASLGGVAEVARSLDGAAVLTAFAIAPKTHWAVFVEQPLSKALATAYRSALRSLALLGLGLAVAAVSGMALARRMVAPIRLLQTGAERLGAGDLAQRLDIRTGDEIEVLAGGFNRMAERLQESYENLEGKVEARTNDLNEALAQQTATADVLKVISRSVADAAPVFETILESCERLFAPYGAAIYLVDGGMAKGVARRGFADGDWGTDATPLAGSSTGRAIAERRAVHIPDLADRPELPEDKRAAVTAYGGLTVLYAPMMSGDRGVGSLVVARKPKRPFSDAEIAFVGAFADQAVIAIENARLFKEVRDKTRDLEESLGQQTATADVLKVISRSAFDLDAVLDTLVISAATLCGADQGIIWVRRGDKLHAGATVGHPPDVTAFFKANPRGLEDKSLAPRVMRSKRTEHIPDRSLDPDFSFPGSKMPDAMLGVPLLRNGGVEGAFTLSRTHAQAFTPRQIELVETFADQAVIAIENARLFSEVQEKTRDLEESLAQQTATADVLKVISRSAFDVQAVLDTLVESAFQLCGAATGLIYIKTGDAFECKAIGGAGAGEGGALFKGRPIRAGRGTAAERVILTGEVQWVTDLSEDPEFDPRLRAALLNASSAGGLAATRSILAVPMKRDAAVVGVIAIARPQTGLFASRQIELLQTFADQAVIAIENTRLFNETEEALKQQTATADVLKVIAASPTEVAPALRAIVESACDVCDGYDAAVILKEGDQLRFSAHRGPIPIGLEKWPVNRSWVGGRAVVDRKPVHVADLLNEDEEFPDGREMARRMGHRTILAVPLMRDGESVGAIVVRRNEVHPFSEKQIALLQTFADQAVIAIGNVRLFDEVQARTRDLQESLEQQQASAEILRVISSSPTDVKPVFDAICLTAARLFACDVTGVFQVEGGSLKTTSASFADRLFEPHELAPDMPLEASHNFPARAAVEKRTLYVRDYAATDTPAHERYISERFGLACGLFLPLLRNDDCIGVFLLTSRNLDHFSERDIALAESFRDQAVIAIENARLFNETKEALERQTATAEILKVIASSPSDTQPVFEAIVTSAKRLLNGRAALLTRFVGDDTHLAAFTTVEPVHDAAFLAAFPRPADDPITKALKAGRIALVEDTESDDDWGWREGAKIGIRSGVNVPLISQGGTIGGLTVNSQEPRAFDRDDVELLRTFADQAAIAIENARLLGDIRESLAQQTATANVLKVISRSAFDLQTVLLALVRSALELCNAPIGTFFLREGDVLHLATQIGCLPELVQHFHDNPIPLDANSGAGRAYSTGKVVHFPDVLADPEYRLSQVQRLAGYRTLLAVPLLSNREPIGVFSLSRTETEPFTQRQIDLMTTFADQAVIAIENSRLFEQVQARTRDLEQSLTDLRKAQDRLVQSEKLASLGQLTAGIAHEIKNPLNFVNNFASLSRELLEELRETLRRLPDDAQADADDLMGMIDSNLEKVASHGKRADSIVKNMLLHSREGSGERSKVSVNGMVEEALNLGYHGARAEKPGFNVTIEKAFDPGAGEADLYLQEVTRVLLNLISNGFYASAKRKLSEGPDFEPTLRATTRSLGSRVEIRVRDNGTGIPDEVRAKMFNPFFTTKPAGEGTGLGLSLSHDIVVKQHGGTLDVETEPNAFTEFIITLPREGAKT